MKNILLTLTLLVSSTFALDSYSKDDYEISTDSVSLASEYANFAEFEYYKSGKRYSRVVDYEEKAKLTIIGDIGISKRDILKSYLKSNFKGAMYAVSRGQVAVLDKKSTRAYRIVGYETEEDYRNHNLLPYFDYLTYYISNATCQKNSKKDIESNYKIFNGNFSQFEINGSTIDIKISYSLNNSSHMRYYKTKAACQKALK